MDEVSMLTAITLFLLSASSELVGVTVLQNGCMDRFRNALNSSDPWVSICVNSHTLFECLTERWIKCPGCVVWLYKVRDLILIVTGSGPMLPAAAVGVPTLQPGSFHSLHPRSGSSPGGEAEGSGAQSTRDCCWAAGCAGGHQGPGESGRHGWRAKS